MTMRDASSTLLRGIAPDPANAVRVYRPAGPAAPLLVLHLQGGAFRDRPLAVDSPVAALLAGAGAVVASVRYPAGALHPFPEALEAMHRVLQRLSDQRARWAGKAAELFVAGEEAGGNLAAALALMARDRRGPPLAGQILLSPMLDSSMATCSARDAEAGPVGCLWADGWRLYLGAPERACHPYAVPAGASRLAGLPRALVITAQDDPMRDESLAYADRLLAAGVVVQREVLPSPSGWPCVLASAAASSDWTGPVRAALARFFADTAPPSSRLPRPATHAPVARSPA